MRRPCSLIVVAVALCGLLFVAAADAASSATPAHGGGKGKAVSQVCSSSAKAWKSQAACSSFEEGICDTVTNSETCGGLCPYLTSQEGCSLVDQAALNAYTTVLTLDVRNVVSADGLTCTETVIGSTPIGYDGPPIEHDCVVPEGGTAVGSVFQCPENYIAVQTLCLLPPQAGVPAPRTAPFSAEYNGLSGCVFPTSDVASKYFGHHVVCQRVGVDVAPPGGAGAAAGRTDTVAAAARDLLSTGWGSKL